MPGKESVWGDPDVCADEGDAKIMACIYDKEACDTPPDCAENLTGESLRPHTRPAAGGGRGGVADRGGGSGRHTSPGKARPK